jgi:hypothetical protein
MVFGLYSLGFAVVIGGLGYGAHLLRMPTYWVVIGAVVLLGGGIASCCPGEQPEFPDEDCHR